MVLAKAYSNLGVSAKLNLIGRAFVNLLLVSIMLVLCCSSFLNCDLGLLLGCLTFVVVDFCCHCQCK